MVMEILAASLARLREEKGVTQSEVAIVLGVSDKTVSKWETAASAPDIEILPALADYYGVTVGALLGSDEEKKDVFTAIRDYIGNDSAQGCMNRQFRLYHELMIAGLPRYPDCRDLSKLPPVVPEHVGKAGVNSGIGVSSACGYERFIDNDDLKLAAAIWPCPDNFASMLENADKYRPLLAFLGKPNAIELIIKTMFTEDFPIQFTAAYVATETGIGIDEATALIGECIGFGLFYKKTAYLTEGETEIYSIYDDEIGSLLVITALAYSIICGGRGLEYGWNYRPKLIRKNEKETTK